MSLIPLKFQARGSNGFSDSRGSSRPLLPLVKGMGTKRFGKGRVKTMANFVVFCASSACGVSSKNLNYVKHPIVRLLYRLNLYYHMR